MPISYWSSDVCSSDSRVGRCIDRSARLWCGAGKVDAQPITAFLDRPPDRHRLIADAVAVEGVAPLAGAIRAGPQPLPGQGFGLGDPRIAKGAIIPALPAGPFPHSAHPPTMSPPFRETAAPPH